MMTEEQEAERIVEARRRHGAEAGRKWAAQQTEPQDRVTICEVADRRYPGNGDDFLEAFAVSGGFIDGAEAYFAEKAEAVNPAAVTASDLDGLQDWHRGHWMQTFTGRAFYPMSPRVEDIDGMDIAHSLALQCRYNGHVKRFYSVAEHCVLMCDWILAEMSADRIWAHEAHSLALWALLHDAAEAYCGDMVRPLKLHMPDFCAVDDRLTTVIAERFGLGVGQGIPAAVKVVDTRILLDERDALLGTPPGDWALEGIEPLGVPIHGWEPGVAKWEYLVRLTELTGEEFFA